MAQRDGSVPAAQMLLNLILDVGQVIFPLFVCGRISNCFHTFQAENTGCHLLDRVQSTIKWLSIFVLETHSVSSPYNGKFTDHESKGFMAKHEFIS